ncbi:MAG: hypothetical protein V8R82_09550 [Clostridia bacterium]
MKKAGSLAGVDTHTGSLDNKKININKKDGNIKPVLILDTG